MRQLGAEGHDFVQARFSWQAHLDQLETVYRRILV
jgi:glycosyltransferase involved in cell wall biosynthesis